MRPMKILINLSGGTHWIGGLQYTRNLLRALSLLPPGDCPPICLRVAVQENVEDYEKEFARLPNITVDRWLPKAPRSWLNWLRGREPARTRLSDDCTVAFPVKGPVPVLRRASLYWVPDFQYKHLPELFSEDDRRTRDESYEAIFRQATYLVLSSKAVQADFERFFPQHHHVRVRLLPFCSVIAADEMAADPSAVRARYRLPERFAYVPNQFWQHKGHDTIFAALARLRDRGLKIPVVATGSTSDYRSADYFDSLRRFIAAKGLDDQLTLLGLIPREDQIQVFRQAALVVHASRFEGWSTVVEDVRALGKPIVLSDLAVHREQAPRHADYFKVGCHEHLAEVLASRWPACGAGPSPSESHAIREAEDRAVRFAKTFLSIAAEAHQAWSNLRQAA